MVKWLHAEDDNNFILRQLGDFNLASWYAVLCSVAFWTITYFSVRYTFTWKSPEWCVRICSLFHGLGTIIRGVPDCVADNGDLIFASCEDESTRAQMLVLVISLGYFIFDLGWCLAYESETNLMIMHHIYSCVAIYRVLVSEMNAGLASCGLAIMEITNPFLQLRWYLRSEGYYNTKIFVAVESTFIIMFFLVRITFGTYFFGVMMNNVNWGWEHKLFSALIYVLSWVFFANIVKYVYLKYLQNNIETEDLRQAT